MLEVLGSKRTTFHNNPTSSKNYQQKNRNSDTKSGAPAGCQFLHEPEQVIGEIQGVRVDKQLYPVPWHFRRTKSTVE